MHQLDRDRSLAHRRRHALHAARAHVTHGEDSGQARLEEERVPRERPVLAGKVGRFYTTLGVGRRLIAWGIDADRVVSCEVRP